MNKQEREAFIAKTFRLLKRQGRPARILFGFCRYRTSEGLKCAIGVHIPDEAYRRDFEQELPNSGSEIAAEILKVIGASASDGAFLRELQGCHDRCVEEIFVISLRSSLIRLAEKYKLDVAQCGLE